MLRDVIRPSVIVLAVVLVLAAILFIVPALFGAGR
jgi:preprotein translocase subunit SecE